MSFRWLRQTRLTRPCSTRSFFTHTRSLYPRTPPLPTALASTPSAASAIPSFRDHIARTIEPASFSQQITRPRIRRQVLFTLFGSWLAFSVAAIATNRDTEAWSEKLAQSNPFDLSYSPSSGDMRRARYLELGKTMQDNLNSLRDSVKNLPKTIQVMLVYSYAQSAQYFLDHSELRRTCWMLSGISVAVWLAWLRPRWQTAMFRRFTHDPLSGRSYTLLTSVFSHKSIIHLAFNCMALNSFGSSAMVYLSKEQAKNPEGMPESTVGYHYVAFFVSAGLVSGLVSHIFSTKFKFPRLVARLSSATPPAAAAPRRFSLFRAQPSAADVAASTERSARIAPSLGASGAIYASVTLTALAFPDAVVSLIFPPTHPIPIEWGIGGLVLLDVVGALRGWMLFDHWAHLGGAAFGAFYYAYGPAIWDLMRSLDAEMIEDEELEGDSR